MLTNSPTTMRAKYPRSLAISPDLDALLEHEEQLEGGALPQGSCSQVQNSGPVAAYNAGVKYFPMALPPPPRGSRRPKNIQSFRQGEEGSVSPTCSNPSWTNDSAQQPRCVEHLGRASTTPNTNPYINPAPITGIFRHGKALEEIKEMAEERIERRVTGNHEKHPKCGQVELSERRPQPSPPSAPLKPHATSQRSHSRTVSLVVDGPFSSCKNVAGVFSDTLSKGDTWGRRHEHFYSFLPRPAGQSKRKAKAIKESGPMAYVLDDNVVLDIRKRYSVEFIDITNDRRRNTWRRRPFYSHGPSRRASMDSIRSGSTIGPSIEQCSHTAQVPDTTESDKQSFIDFCSPTTPQFRPPSLPPLDTSNMLLTRRGGARGDLTPTERQSSPSHSSEPSTPKNILSLPTLFVSSQVKRRSRSGSPRQHDRHKELPPTTNVLGTGKRADLVKKSRKLTRMFGETPGGKMLALAEPLNTADEVLGTDHRRPIRENPRTRHGLRSEPLQHSSNSGRRYSIPVTPDEISESFDQILFNSAPYRATLGRLAEPSNNHPSNMADPHNNKSGSRVSFIDLSDEEDANDETLSPIAFAPNPIGISSHRAPSPSQLSLYEAMTPEQRAEEEKRRNRERLAKLHRFLGSRVPAELVMGVGHLESSLPPIQPDAMASEESERRKQWLRRRRSSSAGALPSWSDDVDRMKEELGGKEKAINVRRAQKMEKLFGVAPPQTLYHTRHSPSPSVPSGAYSRRSKSPKPSFGGFIPPGEVPSPTYQQRNPNRSSYTKQRPKKLDRPGTAESSTRLLPEGPDCYNYDEQPLLRQGGARTSLVYRHYQHSLKSLGDILDRDDKESLAELHQYLNDYEDINAGSPPHLPTPLTGDRRLSNASSIKSERRRSLPTRPSMLSLASEYSNISPKPEVSEFQIRRRRAAKLAQFFGVNYRELINEVLESLETGLEHERKRGTLRAEEVEDLLERLRKIKTNRQGFF